jgi:hypothetical protein
VELFDFARATTTEAYAGNFFISNIVTMVYASRVIRMVHLLREGINPSGSAGLVG